MTPRAAQGPFASWGHRTLREVDAQALAVEMRAAGKTYKQISRAILGTTPETVEAFFRRRRATEGATA